MKRLALLLPALAICAFADPCGSTPGNVVANCSFESNNSADWNSDTFEYSGSVAADSWTFSENSGLSSSGGPWGNGVEDGVFAAFLQQNDGTEAVISQSLTLAANSSYELTFYSAARANYVSDPFDVLFNGTLIGSVTPDSETPELNTFVLDTSVTGADGLLTFQSSAPLYGDLDSTLDDISLVSNGTSPITDASAPEPASMALLGLGSIAVYVVGRRRKNRQS